jgi:hypothetical protein
VGEAVAATPGAWRDWSNGPAVAAGRFCVSVCLPGVPSVPALVFAGAASACVLCRCDPRLYRSLAIADYASFDPYADSNPDLCVHHVNVGAFYDGEPWRLLVGNRM